MKKTIDVEGGWEITRFIKRDKIASQRWGKIWYRFRNGIIKGEISRTVMSLCPTRFVSEKAVKAIKENWPEDFKD